MFHQFNNVYTITHKLIINYLYIIFQFAKCIHKSVKTLTSIALSAIFSREEVATFSLTGKLANCYEPKYTDSGQEWCGQRKLVRSDFLQR